MSRRHSRTSFSHALRRMVHVTEDLVDDALDRAGDFERGVRHSLSDALDDDDRGRRDRDRDDRDRDDRDHDDDRDRDRDHRDHDGHDRRPRVADNRHSGPRPREGDELSALTAQISLLADRLERHRDDGRGLRATGTVPSPRDAEDIDAVRADLAKLSARLDRLTDVAR